MIYEDIRRRKVILAGFVVVAIAGSNLVFDLKEVVFALKRQLAPPATERVSLERPAEPEIPLCTD
jgi:hypothetical protein